ETPLALSSSLLRLVGTFSVSHRQKPGSRGRARNPGLIQHAACQGSSLWRVRFAGLRGHAPRLSCAPIRPRLLRTVKTICRIVTSLDSFPTQSRWKVELSGPRGRSKRGRLTSCRSLWRRFKQPEYDNLSTTLERPFGGQGYTAGTAVCRIPASLYPAPAGPRPERPPP